jgi:hypothetical protein
MIHAARRRCRALAFDLELPKIWRVLESEMQELKAEKKTHAQLIWAKRKVIYENAETPGFFGYWRRLAGGPRS